MLQKSGRLVLWEAMFILELHSAETQAISHLFHRLSGSVYLKIRDWRHSGHNSGSFLLKSADHLYNPCCPLLPR